jgi:hypothetical protein
MLVVQETVVESLLDGILFLDCLSAKIFILVFLALTC